MKIKCFLYCILFLLILHNVVYADPSIKAIIDKDTYDVGEVIIVKIEIEENPGIHGLFFDLSYDSSVITFESIEEGLLLNNPEYGDTTGNLSSG